MAAQRSRESKQRSKVYSGMFSSLAFGTFYLVAGLIGFNTEVGRPRWTGRPVLWEIAIGSIFLLLGVHLFRRLRGSHRVVRRRAAPAPRIKSVGHGRSSGAERTERPSRLPAP